MIFPTVSNSTRISAVVYLTQKCIIQLTALLLVGQLASAIPFEQVTRNLPQAVVHIAHDEVNGQYLAYKHDGSLYGKFPMQDFDQRKRAEAGPCAKLSIEEARQRQCFQ